MDKIKKLQYKEIYFSGYKGKVIIDYLIKDGQLLNVSSSMEPTFPKMITVSNPGQEEKARSPMYVTLAGTHILFKETQLKNAPS